MRSNENGNGNLLFVRAQEKLLQAISAAPAVDLEPPNILPHDASQLSIFQSARGKRKDRNYQVLELIGDAAMHLSVIMVLHDMYPTGTAEIFTHLRSAATSNKTFFFLMKKARLCEDPVTRYTQYLKYLSNGFEIRIGIFFLEKGLPALSSWVKRAFGPLIRACMPDMLQIKADANAINANANAPHTDADATDRKKRSIDDVEISDADELSPAYKKTKRNPILIQVQSHSTLSVSPGEEANNAEEPQSQEQDQPSERRASQRDVFESGSVVPVEALMSVSGDSAILGPTRDIKTASTVSKENLGHLQKNTDQRPTRGQADSGRPQVYPQSSLSAAHRDPLSCLSAQTTVAFDSRQTLKRAPLHPRCASNSIGSSNLAAPPARLFPLDATSSRVAHAGAPLLHSRAPNWLSSHGSIASRQLVEPSSRTANQSSSFALRKRAEPPSRVEPPLGRTFPPSAHADYAAPDTTVLSYD